MKNIDNDVLIHIPNDKKISEAGTEPLGLKPQASLSGVKRSAAEMAVDEHFKKSLAAFHANVASGHKPHYRPGDNMHHLIDRSSADDRFRSPDAMNQGPVVPKSLSATEREAIRRMASTKFKLNDEPPKLTPAPVAMEIDQFESMNLHKNASRNVSVSTSTDPMPGLDQMNLETYKKALEAFIAISKRNVHVFEDSFSPSATAGSNQSSSSTVSIEQSQCKVASPLAKESPTTSGNSFKPKKNWLAQYDVRQAPPDQLSSNLQAPTPGRSSSSTQCSDSTTSQDKQFSDEQMHANRSLLQSIMHHFAREMNDHTSTNTRPVDEKDPDSKKQILMIDLTENNEKSHSSDGSRFPKFIHSKEKTNINLDSSSVKLDVDQVSSPIYLMFRI